MPISAASLTEELKFDASSIYKTAADAKSRRPWLPAQAAPKGVDAHFEMIGGDVFNAVMTLFNPFARVAICGLIADYNFTPGQVPKSAIMNPFVFLVARIKMQGFIISDHLNLWPEGLTALAGHVAAGRLKYRETIAEGLAAAPAAFIGLLKGQNFGKQLVRL